MDKGHSGIVVLLSSMCYNMQYIHTFTEGPNEQQAHPWLCVL